MTINALSSKILCYPLPLGLGQLRVKVQSNLLSDCQVDVTLEGYEATVIISPARQE